MESQTLNPFLNRKQAGVLAESGIRGENKSSFPDQKCQEARNHWKLSCDKKLTRALSARIRFYCCRI